MTHTSDQGVSNVAKRKRHFVNPPPKGDTVVMSHEAALREFARRLQHALVEKGWNQSDLGREASKHMPKGKKLTRDNVSNYIRAKQMPQPLRLSAILKALGLQREDLVPAGAVLELDDTSPPLAMRTLSEGNVWLQINQAVPLKVAMQVVTLMGQASVNDKNGQ